MFTIYSKTCSVTCSPTILSYLSPFSHTYACANRDKHDLHATYSLQSPWYKRMKMFTPVEMQACCIWREDRRNKCTLRRRVELGIWINCTSLARAKSGHITECKSGISYVEIWEQQTSLHTVSSLQSHGSLWIDISISEEHTISIFKFIPCTDSQYVSPKRWFLYTSLLPSDLGQCTSPISLVPTFQTTWIFTTANI
jgi:hypothetical protein